MYRSQIKFLENWRNRKHKPLLIKGVRQSGKTYLVKEFGKQFRQILTINFQKDLELKKIFEKTLDPKKIIKDLELIKNITFDSKNDLIFFDEIQDCAEALNSLKYFCEEAPEINIIGAGSLLGVYLGQRSFPVGKVEFLEMLPMSFDEFVLARGNDKLFQILDNFSEKNEISLAVHDKLLELTKEYYFCGGMPEVIATFVNNESHERVREKQLAIINSYRGDFSKYADAITAIRCMQIFESIPRQLAKDYKKFQFSKMIKGGRYSEFQSAIDWLHGAGIVNKIPIIENTEIPLMQYLEENIFKLYFCDVGLLGAISEVSSDNYLSSQNMLKTFKGALAENLVLQELKSNYKNQIFSWVHKNSEVEFMIQTGSSVLPIEVKSGESGKLKSLNVFYEKYSPKWKIRISTKPLHKRLDQNFINVPLYLTSKIEKIVGAVND
jgi:predicted AAA+ superfamily ATPase